MPIYQRIEGKKEGVSPGETSTRAFQGEGTAGTKSPRWTEPVTLEKQQRNLEQNTEVDREAGDRVRDIKKCGVTLEIPRSSITMQHQKIETKGLFWVSDKYFGLSSPNLEDLDSVKMYKKNAVPCKNSLWHSAGSLHQGDQCGTSGGRACAKTILFKLDAQLYYFLWGKRGRSVTTKKNTLAK